MTCTCKYANICISRIEFIKETSIIFQIPSLLFNIICYFNYYWNLMEFSQCYKFASQNFTVIFNFWSLCCYYLCLLGILISTKKSSVFNEKCLLTNGQFSMPMSILVKQKNVRKQLTSSTIWRRGFYGLCKYLTETLRLQLNNDCSTACLEQSYAAPRCVSAHTMDQVEA